MAVPETFDQAVDYPIVTLDNIKLFSYPSRNSAFMEKRLALSAGISLQVYNSRNGDTPSINIWNY